MATPRTRAVIAVIGLSLLPVTPASAAHHGHPKVSASIPPLATTGQHVRIRGRVAGAKHARVALEQKVGRRWVRRSKSKSGGGGRFSLGWRAPNRRSVVTLRVSSLKSGKSLAASRSVRVAISPIRVLTPAEVKSAPAPGTAGALRSAGRRVAHQLYLRAS